MRTELVHDTSRRLREAGVITADERIAQVLGLALEPHGWKLRRIRHRLADDPLDVEVLVAVLEQSDLALFELIARVGGRSDAPPIVLLTRLALARVLEPVSFHQLNVARIMAWPCRPDLIARALDNATAIDSGAALYASRVIG